MRLIAGSELNTYILDKIDKIKGDFRQEEIKCLWEKVIIPNMKYTVARVNVACSSGTYIRALVHTLGKKFGASTTTLYIKRTKIGNYYGK